MHSIQQNALQWKRGSRFVTPPIEDADKYNEAEHSPIARFLPSGPLPHWIRHVALRPLPRVVQVYRSGCGTGRGSSLTPTQVIRPSLETVLEDIRACQSDVIEIEGLRTRSATMVDHTDCLDGRW
jgi:hypothetical protein